MSPSNTMSPGSRPTSLPTGILIHPAVWPQQTWAENGGGAVPPFSGGAGSPCRNVAWVEVHHHGEPFYKRSPKMS